MTVDPIAARPDPALIHAWLRGRSVARDLPPPVPEHGGWRIDTGSAEERRRYVFAAAGDGLRDLVAKLDEPRVPLKLCATDGELMSLLPDRWKLQRESFVMIYSGAAAPEPLPDGYRIELSTRGPKTTARILGPAGELAASGYAAEVDGAFVYDRIRTELPHRRRGLGRALMAALGTARRAGGAQQILVATPEGRLLYETLGWRHYCPYATALIPDVTA